MKTPTGGAAHNSTKKFDAYVKYAWSTTVPGAVPAGNAQGSYLKTLPCLTVGLDFFLRLASCFVEQACEIDFNKGC